jgi:hypothetical protein
MRLIDVDALANHLATISAIIDIADDYERDRYSALMEHDKTPGDSGANVVHEERRVAERMATIIPIAQGAADSAIALVRTASERKEGAQHD